jgi:RNA polymerase sigma factor (sigma-70 family)
VTVNDEELAQLAVAGDHDALDQLIRRHQPWIFNLALRMAWYRDRAEDATQEILMKAVTKIHTFRGASLFRTWLYRIAVNHLLDIRQTETERKGDTFADFGRGMDSVPDFDPPDSSAIPIDVQLVIDETRHACMYGMLLCLDRRQRLAFILGEVFGVSSQLGGEMMDESPANFRQLLTRARRDLYQFMNNKCGLINSANPCRCARKTRAFMDAGFVDPGRRSFTGDHVAFVREIAPSRIEELQSLDRQHAELFRQQSWVNPPDFVSRLRALVESSPLTR